MIIDCANEKPNAFPQILHVRAHELRSDIMPADSAPGPHDYFDAALAACKTLTALVYARSHGIALESVESHVERDDHEERNGKYLLKVRLAFNGPLSDDDRNRLYAAVGRCPLHKLMTTTEITIETAPL